MYKNKVTILCGGNKFKNIFQNNKDYQNDIATAIIRCYRRDLGFRKPKYFDPSVWEERGIKIITPFSNKYKTIRAIKAVSIMRKRRVFLLWGQSTIKYLKWIEPNQGHLILVGFFPGTNSKDSHWMKQKWFSWSSDFLGESREMWRLP